MNTKIRKVPLSGLPQEHNLLLNEMRTAIMQLQSSSLPPDDPTNLKVTPIATGNNIQFTRSTSAQRYTLYISNTPTRNAANPQEAIAIDLGDSNTHVDVVGQANFSRYYWVRAWNGNSGSRLVGPVKGTTLASGATVNPPVQVPAGKTLVIDQTTGLPVSVTPPTQFGGGRVRNP